MSNNQPDVQPFEVDADPPTDDEKQRMGDPDPGRDEIPTELPADNEDFVKDLPGRLDED